MKFIGRSVLLSAATATLLGCDMVSDFAETQKKSDAIAVEIEKDLGVKPMVGWNIHNGTLTHVNVQLPLESVAKLSVGELDAKVRAVVAKSFERPPEQLVVSTFSKKNVVAQQVHRADGWQAVLASTLRPLACTRRSCTTLCGRVLVRQKTLRHVSEPFVAGRLVLARASRGGRSSVPGSQCAVGADQVPVFAHASRGTGTGAVRHRFPNSG